MRNEDEGFFEKKDNLFVTIRTIMFIVFGLILLAEIIKNQLKVSYKYLN